jgi:hydroxymethylpyrimidine pyrophosphatase-like HAD family hydrolase
LTRRFSEISAAALSKIRYVLTDIDDTLTHEGLLPSRTYLAIERLHKAGFKVVPVTAGSSRWCDLPARMWPVDAVIGESGGLCFSPRGRLQSIIRGYWSAQPIETHFIPAHVVDTVIGLIMQLNADLLVVGVHGPVMRGSLATPQTDPCDCHPAPRLL